MQVLFSLGSTLSSNVTGPVQTEITPLGSGKPWGEPFFSCQRMEQQWGNPKHITCGRFSRVWAAARALGKTHRPPCSPAMPGHCPTVHGSITVFLCLESVRPWLGLCWLPPVPFPGTNVPCHLQEPALMFCSFPPKNSLEATVQESHWAAAFGGLPCPVFRTGTRPGLCL